MYYTASMARTDQSTNTRRTASRQRLKRSNNRGERPGDRSRGSRFLRWLGFFIVGILVALLSFAAGGYLGLVEKVSDLQGPEAASTYPTYLYSEPLGDSDDTARVIGRISGGENRSPTSLEDMPQSLLNALVAKEDERFREHAGVDVWGILRALYIDLRAGKAVEGASTITQQYVKNAYLSQDRSISRKLKEAALAIEVERRYTKNQILAKYLNTVYFGNNAYGAGAAAETYFDKSVDDLTLGESAALIGLLWSPSTLGADKEAAREQRDLVLEKMFNAGYATRQDYIQALEEPLPGDWPAAPPAEPGLSSPQLTRGFADIVYGELVERYGAGTVRRGGLSVYTTLNLKDQVAAEQTLYGEYLNALDDPDAALVSIAPRTGEVRTMVGNQEPGSHFNLVTQAQRQPGSSFKPFALIAALEQGVDPSTTYVSEDKEYGVKIPGGGTETWNVENYDGKERGEISLKQALWQSDNSVFTDLVMNVGGRGLENGPAKVAEVANRLGISADFGPSPHPSITLGSEEVSPMGMAVAYATIANYGKKVEPTTIQQVVRDKDLPDEKVLYTAPKPAGKQVIDEKVAERAVRIMQGDIEYGINQNASLGERPAAGKSGTSERLFDSWFIGFTPQLATALWVGYSEGGETLGTVVNGEAEFDVPYPAAMWQTYMERAMKGKPTEDFRGEPEDGPGNVPAPVSERAATPEAQPGVAANPATPVSGQSPPATSTGATSGAAGTESGVQESQRTADGTYGGAAPAPATGATSGD